MNDPSINNLPVASNYLTPKEKDLVRFIEKFHATAGVTPTDAGMIDYLASLGYPCSDEELATIKKNPLFLRSMQVRGIVIDNQSYIKVGHLTERQMRAVALYTNIHDRRSDEKKLRDIGVSTTEWSTWMLDQKFVDYLHSRVERILPNSIHEAHLGLIRGARAGNVPAIKLLYEITDRYNPDKDNQINVRQMLGRIVEVIQMHVKDPAILQSLAVGLQGVAMEFMPTGVNSQIVQGKAIERGE